MSPQRDAASARAPRLLLVAGLAGSTLLLAGGGALAATAGAEPPPPETATPAEIEAFLASPYTWDDAAELTSLWGTADAYEAKMAAGELLLQGEELPVPPASLASPAAPDAMAAFLSAGYDYEDALVLGDLWGVDSIEAKTMAGERLEAGETLPVEP